MKRDGIILPSAVCLDSPLFISNARAINSGKRQFGGLVYKTPGNKNPKTFQFLSMDKINLVFQMFILLGESFAQGQGKRLKLCCA